MSKRVIALLLCLTLVMTPAFNTYALEADDTEPLVTDEFYEHQYDYTDNGDGTHDGICSIENCYYSIKNEEHDFLDGECSKCGAKEEVETVGETELVDLNNGDELNDENGEKKEELDEIGEIYPAFDQSATVNGVVITVTASEGVFPSDAQLSVERVSRSDEEFTEGAVEDVRDEDILVAVSYTFDIKVLDSEGNELQPADDHKVMVLFSTEEVADSNLETDVYHISDAGEAEKLITETNDDVVSVETEGFSYYTVEFTYHELQYVMEGYACVSLQDILDAIKLDGNVTDVQCSDTSLFEATENDGEWVISSLQPFTSKEWMKVTINDIVYEIKVTDALGTPTGNAIRAAAQDEWNRRKGNVQERGGNYGKMYFSQKNYAAHGYPYGNDAWCALFVSYCLRKAGVISNSYSTARIGKQLVDAGRAEYVSSPMPGDIVEYYVPGAAKPYYHVGIVDGIVNGHVMSFHGDLGYNGVSGGYPNYFWVYCDVREYTIGHPQIRYVRVKDSSTPMPDPQPQDHNPKYVLDSATSNSPGTITVRGWAFDPDDTSAKLKIKVSGGPGGSYLGELTANKSRPDVNNVYGCGNNHGFEGTFNIEWDATWTGKVYVNIINVGSGSNETSPRITVTVQKDTVPPTITELYVTNKTPDGCTLKCSIYDNLELREQNIGVYKEVHDENGNVYSDKLMYKVSYADGVATCNLTPYDRPGHIYVFTVKATDIQGNSISKSLTIDWGESNPPEPENHDPVYSFDSVMSKSPGTVTVRGWAYDPDDTDAKLNITVWGGPGMFKLGTITADKVRNDVNDIYGCGNKHGFEATFPIDWNGEWTGSYRAYVDITNVGAGNDVTSAQKSFTVEKDTTSPTISSLKVTDISSAGCTLSCTVSDNAAVKDVLVKKEVQDDEGNTYSDNKFYSTTASDGLYSIYLQPYDQPGQIYVYTVKATDMQGNSSSKSITVDLGVSSTPENHDPIYSLETVTSDSPSMITVRGWAFDPDDTTAKLSVTVYGGPGNPYMVKTTANKTRTDINDTYGCGNDHGFESTFPVMWAGTDKLYIIVTNVGEGEDVTSAQKSVTVEKYMVPPSIIDVSVSDVSSTGCTLTCSVSDDMKVANVEIIKEVIDDNGNSYSDSIRYVAHATDGVYKIDLEPYDRPGHIYKFTVVATDILWNSTSKIITVDLENPNTSVTGVTLDSTSRNVVIGDLFDLTETVTPSNATNKSVTWSSNNPNVATVDQIGNVTAISPGSTDIVVTTDDGGFTARCTVTVSKQRLSINDFIVMFPDSTVYDGNEKEVTVTGGPSDYNGVVSIEYFDDSGIALTGAPKAIGSYRFVLVAAEDEKYVGLRSGSSAWSFSITNNIIPVSSVSLSKTSLTLSVGASSTLRASVLPDDASNKNVTWSSDNPSIASVSQNGLINAVAQGETYITVTTDDGNKNARCKVTVQNRLIPNPSPTTPIPTPTPKPSSGGSSGSNSSSSSTSGSRSSSSGSSSQSGSTPASANPNAIAVASFVPASMTGAGTIVGDVKISNQEQGPIAKFLFKLFTPAGWKEAFTLNLTVNGSQDYTLKKGKLTFYIPPTYRKQGRTFALISIVKPGQIKYFLDTDKNPETITVDLDCEGYAFDLIYFDLPTAVTKK